MCSKESRNSPGNEGAERLFKQVQLGSCPLQAGVYDGGGDTYMRAGFESGKGVAVGRLEPVLVPEQDLKECLNVIESEDLILVIGTIRRPEIVLVIQGRGLRPGHS